MGKIKLSMPTARFSNTVSVPMLRAAMMVSVSSNFGCEPMSLYDVTTVLFKGQLIDEHAVKPKATDSKKIILRIEWFFLFGNRFELDLTY